ncbi:MAG: tetratricopeptide repeat protein [Kofleriaceae bacterium]|nr:tetratricopeptide repeat protein [Kofleriaceae bacterium]
MDRKVWGGLMLAGTQLSAEEAAALESRLVESPDDLEARVKLAAYYGPVDPNRDAHALWLIAHHPTYDLTVLVDLDERTSPGGYREAKRLWLAALEREPTNAAIRYNAHHAFTTSDEDLAEQILRDGIALEPTSPEWWRLLADQHARAATFGAEEARPRLWRAAMEEYERAIELMPVSEAPAASCGVGGCSEPDTGRYSMQISLAEVVFEAGDADRARALAQQILDDAPSFVGMWVHGNGIHWANILLGRIALAHGDVDAARAYLAAAATTPGSPQLNSFGPDQRLAAAFLKRGERETVIAYIEGVRHFYKGTLGMLTGAHPFKLTVLDGGKE